MRILLLDQDPNRARQAAAALKEHNVEAARTPEEAAERIRKGDRFDVMAVSEGFPGKGMEGIPTPPPMITLPDPGKGAALAAVAEQAIRARALEDEVWQLRQALESRGREILLQERAREEHAAALTSVLQVPLETVRSVASSIAAGLTPEGAAAAAGQILEELARLGDLAQAVWKLARIESGRAVLDRGFLPVRRLLEGALKMVGSALRDGKISTDVRAEGDLLAYADPAHLVPALAELLRESLPGARAISLIGTPAGDRLEMLVRPEGDVVSDWRPGVGFRLACAAARDHGGDVIVERERGGRTRYILWLPRVNERDVPETWIREELHRALQMGTPFTLLRVEARPSGSARLETILKASDRWLPIPGEDATLVLLPGMPPSALWSLAARVSPFFGRTSLPFRSLTFPDEAGSVDAFLARGRMLGFLPNG